MAAPRNDEQRSKPARQPCHRVRSVDTRRVNTIEEI